MKDIPYIYSRRKTRTVPLELYLPAHRPGSIKAWLGEFPLGDQLILSPFGSSPQAILEASRAGSRMLVPAHNPILRFLIEGLAKPVPRDTLNTALVRLASSYKGDQRLKPLILSLYDTDCPQCGKTTPASSFTWSREKGLPVQKTCRCSSCGEDSQGPVTGADLARAAEFQDNSPAHARALTRVSAPDDPIMFQVEIALRSYPPRAVYALLTLFNKITGLDLSAEQRSHLERLLLYAFYRSSSPETRIRAERREGSEKEDDYLEENVWYSMEDALDIWSEDQPEIPLSTWPELPPAGGGITLFPGRVRELIPILPDLPIGAVMLVFPRPSLSLWALSALWTGWLWGQDAAAPLRNILSVRNYDWPWMARAIGSTLSELRQNLAADIPYLGSLPELNTSYLLTSLAAASLAGLRLDSLAVEPDQEAALTVWSPGNLPPENPPAKNDREIIQEAGFSLLNRAGEPKHTLSLYGAGLMDLSRFGSLGTPDPAWEPEIQIPRLAKDFDENIAYRKGFLHYSKSGNWWHQDLSLAPDPQSDQVEQCLVSLLVSSNSPLPENEIYQHIYREFPGLGTPKQSLIQTCLDSYAERTSQDPPIWKLKESDLPARRKSDLEEMEEILHHLGKELGFSVTAQDPLGNVLHLVWHTEISLHYSFFVSASGLLNKILAHFKDPPSSPWIILPGSRVGLIHYKMDQNPPLEEMIRGRYGLVKFRHIRRLAEQGGLTHSNLKEQLAVDPFTSESPQLHLI
jgi:hypothetical protein